MGTLEDIKNREDIRRLVTSFYSQVRKDPSIGPVFNTIIHDWKTHIELLTDFWETNLFFKVLYKGNPHRAHIKVDQQVGGIITQEHFGKWLELWFKVIDRSFEGPAAETAKNRARKMSTMMFIKIYQARETGLGAAK